MSEKPILHGVNATPFVRKARVARQHPGSANTAAGERLPEGQQLRQPVRILNLRQLIAVKPDTPVSVVVVVFPFVPVTAMIGQGGLAG